MRVLIVDDETHARHGLQALLASERDVEVVGKSANGEQAVEMIRRLKPDLVFLDIEMPDISGLDVIQQIGPDDMPRVIFVTAYDEYAVSAFEASAVDYLLKPFTDERFQDALTRARDLLGSEEDRLLGNRLRKLLEAEIEAPATLERFTVKSGDKLRLFCVDDIDWIEADEYYVKLHIGGEAHLIRQTMNAMQDQLPHDRFARIHRSTIVNLDRIAVIEPLFHGDHEVVLDDGTRLRMSRRRREALAGVLKTFT